MGRAPCCSKVGLHRGPWSSKEDTTLIKYIQQHGEGHWRSLPKNAGLLRCGKSCRLRWMNYLRPDIKRGNITLDEEDLIIRMHSLLGNRWSLIARMLPGRTDNEIKNYWNSHLSKRVDAKLTGAKPKPSNTKTNRGPSKQTNTTSSETKHKKNNKQTINTEIKVHQPKAVRVSPFSITRNNSFDSGPSTVSSCDLPGAREGLIEAMNYSTIQSMLEGGVDDHISYRDYCCSIIEEVDGSHSIRDLDKILEEYQQLIREDDNVLLDAFADSMFIDMI